MLCSNIILNLSLKTLRLHQASGIENITLEFFNGDKKSFTIETESLKVVLKNSDFITLHIPKDGGKSIIGAEEIGMMKTGAGIINAARGGVIDETALMFALDKEKLAYAGLDVFENDIFRESICNQNPNVSINIFSGKLRFKTYSIH